MEEPVEELADLGILVYGSKRTEYAVEIPILLGRRLPPDWEWVESSSNTIIARRLQPSPAYYKEFLNRSRLENIKTLFRGSRCQRAVIRGELLRKKGFNTPAMDCWGKKGHRYFMITEGIDAVSLSTHIEKNWIPPLAGKELVAKRELIEKLGNEIGTLHGAGVCHGDLRLSNLLVEEEGQDISFHFIDNERSSFFKKIPRRLVVKNLVQLNMIFLPNVSRQDRLRFINAYSNAYGRFESGEKMALMKAVYERTMERLAKKLDKNKRAKQDKT